MPGAIVASASVLVPWLAEAVASSVFCWTAEELARARKRARQSTSTSSMPRARPGADEAGGASEAEPIIVSNEPDEVLSYVQARAQGLRRSDEQQAAREQPEAPARCVTPRSGSANLRASVAAQPLRLRPSVAADFLQVPSASGLVSPGRQAATFLPRPSTGAGTENPLSRTWRGAASSAVSDFVMVPSASGLGAPGRHGATFLPYGQEDRDLGVIRADPTDLARSAAAGASRSVGPTETGEVAGPAETGSRLLPLPPAQDRPAYIQGLLDGQFGSYGLSISGLDGLDGLRQAADASLPSSAAVESPEEPGLQTALDEVTAAAADEISDEKSWESPSSDQ